MKNTKFQSFDTIFSKEKTTQDERMEENIHKFSIISLNMYSK